jgi:hypothetical protein
MATPDTLYETLSLLLLALRANDDSSVEEEALRIIEKNQVNPERLYELADRHAIKPQVARLVKRLPRGTVGKDFSNRIEEAYQDNLVAQLDHVSEFFRVRNSLAAEDIIIVPFKGFWLAEAFYGNLADRESGDIDVFVNFSDLERIKALMPATGYLPGAPYLPEVNKSDCEYNFGRYSDGKCVSHFEFHWRIAPAGFGLDISLEDLSSEVMPARLQDEDLEVFSPAASLLLTVMHHGGKDAFRFLKQVYDIAMIITHSDDLDTVWLLREAGRYHCRTLVLVAVRLASMITGVEVPASMVSESSSGRVLRLVMNRMKSLQISPDGRRRFWPIVNDWIFRIRSRDGFGVKARLTVRFIRKEIMPRLVPKWLLPLFMRKYIIPDYAK